MKIKRPIYLDTINLISIILLPFTLFTFLFNNLKKLLPKSRFKLKTICVGNIYLGGTGKTPLVIKINSILKKKYKTAIIKKNYLDQKDEKEILKKNGNLLCFKNRDIAIKSAENKNFDIAICDDGLQEKKINYDLSIACFNSTHTIGNGFLIPAGPLRESLFEIRNYDAVFLNGEKKNIKFQNKIKKINKNIKIFYANYKPTNLKFFNLKKNYLIFCGLGNPEEFEKTLIKYKFKIKEKKFFPDHYNFSNKDINEIKSLAKEKRLEIVTSEKDYLRLDNSKKKNIKFIKVDLKISNQKKFESFLNKNL